MTKEFLQRQADQLAAMIGEVAPCIGSEKELREYAEHVDVMRRLNALHDTLALNRALRADETEEERDAFGKGVERVIAQKNRNREFVEKRAEAKHAQGEKTVEKVLLAYKNSTLPERLRASAIAKQVGVKAGQVRRIIARRKAANQKIIGAEKPR